MSDYGTNLINMMKNLKRQFFYLFKAVNTGFQDSEKRRLVRLAGGLEDDLRGFREE